jgi:hypothetical protein
MDVSCGKANGWEDTWMLKLEYQILEASIFGE